MIDELIRRFPGSSPGSQLRNAFSFSCAFLSVILLLEIIISKWTRPVFDLFAASVMCIMAIVYFLTVIVAVIFLTSQRFRLKPVRLARDTLISITFMILAFALLHRENGITLSGVCPEDFGAFDPLYFSAVTFSTLGYGDFRPCPNSFARLSAALEALLGNLHLGLIVGTAFFFATEPQDVKETRSPPHKQAQQRARRK